MKVALLGWQSPITYKKITQTIVNGFVTDTATIVTFDGVVQPLSAEKINLKPEGQRSWQWLQIHCKNGINDLKTNDKITYNEKAYKVMEVLDYSNNGFVEYHVVKDFQ
jgi:hypothetical protein